MVDKKVTGILGINEVEGCDWGKVSLLDEFNAENDLVINGEVWIMT